MTRQTYQMIVGIILALPFPGIILFLAVARFSKRADIYANWAAHTIDWLIRDHTAPTIPLLLWLIAVMLVLWLPSVIFWRT